MREGFDFDGALKGVFQEDHPTLLYHLTRGLAVQEFLNVELPKVQARRVDLVLSLEVAAFSTSSSKVPMTETWPIGWSSIGF